MNYYQFHIADFALHTSHLTLEEEAVYRRLLDHYYDTESPIPKKTEPVIRRLRLVSHAAIVESILKEFFVLKDDGWHNLRADFEISEYNAKAEIARENGKKGGRPKKNKELNNQETEPVILANPQETGSKANQEPRTSNQEPEKSLSGKPDSTKRNAELKTQATEVLQFLNTKTGRNYQPVNGTLDSLIARLREGFTVTQLRQVVAKKSREWGADEKMEPYLRPKTLFNRTNFANYVGELVEVKPDG
jgi:uncharacterized phage protein (TIGR02220 family)